jgi:hypothetical protein
VSILFPDNIPIWGDIRKISGYHANSGEYAESLDVGSSIRADIFLVIIPISRE